MPLALAAQQQARQESSDCGVRTVDVMIDSTSGPALP